MKEKMNFLIGRDCNTELKLQGGGEEFEGLNSRDWYGLHGPECRGGGEDVTYEKFRWLQ